jgi:poly-beta-1,6-N-acetyl-D-glucosamine synthase
MLALIALFFVILGLDALVYILYSILVLGTKKKKSYMAMLNSAINAPINRESLPRVTVLVPAYNEEVTMHNKIKNIADLEYPSEKISVLVLDDCSTDETRTISEASFKEFKVNGKVISNPQRSGVNVSYNNAFPQVTSEYVMTTDADARIPSNSLLKAMKVMLSDQKIGAVAAKMVPLYEKQTLATRAAEAYATTYDSMLVAESSLFSTFPGSTSCLLMRTKAFSEIPPSYGSSDGNISLGIIKNGFKFLLAPNISYLEPITQNAPEQRRQKIRRATRLIQSTLFHFKSFRDKNFGVFGQVIFPLRFLMMTLCPMLTIAAIILFFVISILMVPYVFIIFFILAIAILALGAKTNIKITNLIQSFLLHQFYLLCGFLLSYRKVRTWQKIERTSNV